MAWLELADLKSELGLKSTDSADDEVLTRIVGACRRFVERRRPELDYDTPNVPEDVHLGALRLAVRYAARRRSPDGMIALAELGAARVPRLDSDIRDLLGLDAPFSIRPGGVPVPVDVIP